MATASISVNGQCEPGFEDLRNAFTSHLESGKDEHAQLCVYVDGRCVADLWGSSVAASARGGETTYGPDLLHVSHSQSLTVNTIMGLGQILLLHSR